MVHASRGRLAPGSPQLRSEVAIVCGLGQALFGDDLGWPQMGDDYRVIRRHIEHVVPGFHAFEERVAQPGGFVLPNGPRDSRTFPTATGKARFTVNPPDTASTYRPGTCCCRPCARTTSSTPPSTASTTATAASRAAAAWCSSTPTTCARSGFADGDVVDLVSVWPDGERRARGFRVVDYATPRGCAAAYFPEANVLVPLDSTAEGSNTPTSKSVVIRLERPQG